MSAFIAYHFNLTNFLVLEKLVRQVEFRNMHGTYDIKIVDRYYIKSIFVAILIGSEKFCREMAAVKGRRR
jgi:hypothetical protein